MKVIIAGGRDFDNYPLLKEKCCNILSRIKLIEVVSGAQVSIKKRTGRKYGADYLGEQFAKEFNYPIKQFPADWDNLGKSAGPVRNEQMANYSDALIAFWNRWSTGTKDMINKAENHGLKIRIIYC